MEVTVRKPTAEEAEQMKTNSTWECEPSEFDWSYSQSEHCLLSEGRVEVDYDGKTVSFGAGDYVVFPKGLKCVWKVMEKVRKNYYFGD